MSALLLLLVTQAQAQDAAGFVALLDQAKAAIAAGDFKSARQLLAQADTAAASSDALIMERDLARLPFYLGLVEWRAGDKDTAALNHWRDAITLSTSFAPEADVLPESDGQDVYYALMGEVKARESVTLGLPEDPLDTVIFVDGRRMEPFDAVLVGRHFIQLRCPEGNVAGSWYTFGAPPPDYLVLCSGGAYPVAKGGGKPPKDKGPSKAELARAEKEAAKREAAERAAADKAAKEAAAAEKAAADKAAAEKAAADKAAAEKAAADKAAADKAAADKAAADKAAADKADKAAADKAAADKAAADKAAADKAAADKAAADKAAADKAAAGNGGSSTARVDKGGGGGALGWAMIAGGGAMLAGGGVVNFLVVNPAWSEAQDANEDPRTYTRAEADAIVSRFNTGRYATIGLLAAGVATAGVGVFLGPLDTQLFFTPNGLGVGGRW